MSPSEVVHPSEARKAPALMAGSIAMATDTGNKIILHDGNVGRMQIFTGSTERLSVANAGNVGIGSTNPGQKIDINGNVRYNNLIGAISVYDNGNSGAAKTVDWNNGNFLTALDLLSKRQ